MEGNLHKRGGAGGVTFTEVTNIPETKAYTDHDDLVDTVMDISKGHTQ